MRSDPQVTALKMLRDLAERRIPIGGRRVDTNGVAIDWSDAFSRGARAGKATRAMWPWHVTINSKVAGNMLKLRWVAVQYRSWGASCDAFYTITSVGIEYLEDRKAWGFESGPKTGGGK